MYRFGLIGYGAMGNYHAQQIGTMPDFAVSAVYDIAPEKREKARAEGRDVCDSLEELLMRKDVDAVILAVPNNFHKPLAVAAMHAGKHVLCEKPVMMNSRDLLEVLAVSEQTGMLFTVHQNRRWDRDFCIVRECIQSGALGRPFYIESRVQGAKGIPGDWRCTQEAGGGMLLDWGVHLLDQLLLLADSPVREVYAHLLSVKFPEVDDNFKVMLRFENGLSALVEVDTYTFIPLPRWHVSGEKGTLQVDDFACGGKMVCAKNTEMHWDEGIVYTAAGPTRTMAPRPRETVETLSLPQVQTDARDYYVNFRDAQQGGREPAVTHRQMLAVMRVIDAIFVSAKEHRAVKPEE